MKELSVLSGVVSHLKEGTAVFGSGGSVHSMQQNRFRVDGEAALFGGGAQISNGDHVTLVGFDSGEFTALALRNDSLGLRYYAMEFMIGLARLVFYIGLVPTAICILVLIFSHSDPEWGMIIFLGLFAAILIIPGGGGLAWELRRKRKVLSLLDESDPGLIPSIMPTSTQPTHTPTPPVPPATACFCGQCGKPQAAGLKFCTSCGAPVVHS